MNLPARVGLLLGSLLVVLGSVSCQQPEQQSAAPESRPPAPLPAPTKPPYQMTEAELGRYLQFVKRIEPRVPDRVVMLGRQNIGQPYEIYLLGEFPFDFHDPDPIYCLTKSDCVTFCEHVFAMTFADDWWSFLRNLQRIRYRDGEVGMRTRNHWTVADWNRQNAFLFEDLTPALGEGKAAVALTQTVNRADFFGRFGIGQDIAPEAVEDTYIPTANVPDILDELRDGDFVNIIRGNDQSQYAGHTGLVALGPEGTVNFLHSARPAVREEPLLDYLAGDKRCVGVKFLRLRPNAGQLLAEAIAGSPAATDISEASLFRALAAYRDRFPPAARPAELNWVQASRLQGLRLPADAPVDARLQQRLSELDEQLRTELDLSPEQRAVGVLVLNDQRLAWLASEQMFYAASVPKLIILAAYFEYNVDDPAALSRETIDELGLMIKHSDNGLATKYAREVGLEKIQEFVESREYRFYDQDAGGGFWMGKFYAQDDVRVGDPLMDHSHAATVRQVLRYYLLLEQCRLVDFESSVKMREIIAAPNLQHQEHAFLAALDPTQARVWRKSGTWQEWQHDTARIEHSGVTYLLVGLTQHPEGRRYLEGLARGIDRELTGNDTVAVAAE